MDIELTRIRSLETRRWSNASKGKIEVDVMPFVRLQSLRKMKCLGVLEWHFFIVSLLFLARNNFIIFRIPLVLADHQCEE